MLRVYDLIWINCWNGIFRNISITIFWCLAPFFNVLAAYVSTKYAIFNSWRTCVPTTTLDELKGATHEKALGKFHGKNYYITPCWDFHLPYDCPWSASLGHRLHQQNLAPLLLLTGYRGHEIRALPGRMGTSVQSPRHWEDWALPISRSSMRHSDSYGGGWKKQERSGLGQGFS
jgi:hypothetical protein